MKRILLIEDDGGAQLLYRNRLTELGFQVAVSATGAMGLMEARSAPFDLFLVDIGLGSGIDGYEVCRRLKAIPEIHAVPVVLLSGSVKSQEDLHRGYEAGCQSFLVKGDLMLLEDVVRAMLRIKSLQDDLAMQNRLLEERNRRFEAEKARSADLEHALSHNLGRGGREHERPDGMLLVDGDGVVRMADRAARDLLGQAIDGKNLARLAPDSRLEASVRNARTEPDESIRFELPPRGGRAARALNARVYPLVPQPGRAEPALRVVLLFDAARRPQSAVAASGDENGFRREWAPLVEAAREVFRPEALLGSSQAVRELRGSVTRLAQATGPVLLQGPSGSGKTFVARILHYSSPRAGPLLTVCCASAGSSALERELFGAAEGSVGELAGAFHRARGGTLFLQDVERLDAALQERVLEALVHGQIRRQGASGSERVDVRLLAGTRVDLKLAATQGGFLPALAERLGAETVLVPSAKERAEDVAALVQHFAARHGRSGDVRFLREAVRAIALHEWPENVRDIERVVQGACATARTSEVALADLPQPLPDLYRGAGEKGSGALAPRAQGYAVGTEVDIEALPEALEGGSSLLDAYEKGALLHALRLTHGHNLAAAKLLRIGKSTFYRKLRQHGL